MDATPETSMTPEQMVAKLLAGEPVRVNSHFVIYEPRDGFVWYTNAYGVDGILCEVPTVEAMRRFLDDMRRGLDYGPVPHGPYSDDDD